MASIAQNIPFSQLCNLCEKITNAPKEKKDGIFKRFLTDFHDFAKKLQQENEELNVSFYPLLRLLVPQLDRERSAYGVKEHALAKIFIKILCLPKEGQDSKKLLNFRSSCSSSSNAGDFADVAFWVLRKYCPEKGNFSVEQINTCLDNVAAYNAANDRRQMEAELITILQNMPAADQKWLIRMLLKDVKVGLTQNKILRLYHPDGQELYDISNNLEKVCQLLRDPSRRLHEIELEVFTPFRPMLAEQFDVQKVDSILKTQPYCIIETKYDGERFQLHYKDGNFKYFSRNGHEYSEVYGQTVFSGLLSPHIAKQLQSNVTSCILDGEMMVWHTKNKFFKSKGDNIDVKSMKLDDCLKPCFCVFDVLLYNDVVLTNKTYEERIQYMDELFVTAEGVIHHTVRKKVTTKDEVMEELNKAIDDKLEGIMLKQPVAIYKPNHRKGGWFKLKPEYTDGVMDHIDAIIMGGYHGEGRRSGLISHFLIGLAVPSKDGYPKEFHSVGRVGSGYSMSKLEELHNKLSPHWQKVKLGQCPPGLVWTKEKPDLWIDPQKSYILQIKATEIVESKLFKLDYTLRFPRVEHIRYDKNWNDCMTIEEFENLRQLAAGKLYTRHVVSNNFTDIPSKKRRQPMAIPITLAKQFQCADLSQVEKISNFLSGKEFCVINGHENLSKQDIEREIHQHGGTFVANPGSDTFCILIGEINLRVDNIIKSGRYNVASVSWFQQCLKHNSLLPWSPADLFKSTDATTKMLELSYDKYGDSYTSPATIETLQYSLNQVDKLGDTSELHVEKVAEMDIELFGGASPYGIFRLCYAYFDKYAVINDPNSEKSSDLDLVALDFCFYGGLIHEAINNSTTHVIIHLKNSNRLQCLQELNHKRQKKFHIVTQAWVEESVETHERLKEEIYSAITKSEDMEVE